MKPSPGCRASAASRAIAPSKPSRRCQSAPKPTPRASSSGKRRTRTNDAGSPPALGVRFSFETFLAGAHPAEARLHPLLQARLLDAAQGDLKNDRRQDPAVRVKPEVKPRQLAFGRLLILVLVGWGGGLGVLGVFFQGGQIHLVPGEMLEPVERRFLPAQRRRLLFLFLRRRHLLRGESVFWGPGGDVVAKGLPD